MINKAIDDQKISFTPVNTDIPTVSHKSSVFNEGVFYKDISRTKDLTILLLIILCLGISYFSFNYISKEKILYVSSGDNFTYYQKNKMPEKVVIENFKQYLHVYGNIDFDNIDDAFTYLYRHMEVDLRGRFKVEMNDFVRRVKKDKLTISSKISEIKTARGVNNTIQVVAILKQKLYLDGKVSRPAVQIIEMVLKLGRPNPMMNWQLIMNNFKSFTEDEYKRICDLCLLK